MANYALQSGQQILPLFALSALDHLEEENWRELVNEYDRISSRVERYNLQSPRWLVDDNTTIDAILDEYEESRRDRKGLYRALGWGGAAVSIAGGGLWSWGLMTALDNEDTYDEYQVSEDPTEVQELRKELETDREMANVLQIGGIGAAAVGLGSFVTGVIVERRDRRVPEREMIQRLEYHFDDRMEFHRDVKEEASGRIEFPLSEFSSDGM